MTRDRILDSAAKVFAQYGYRLASMELVVMMNSSSDSVNAKSAPARGSPTFWPRSFQRDIAISSID